MYTYSAYDLGIQSSLFLPELVPVETSGDVEIRVLNSQELPFNDNFNAEIPYLLETKKAYLHFTEVGTFYINNGNEIVIQPLPDIEERLIRLPLLGAAFAVLLDQRGYFVLHSSAVEIDGKAVAFVGNKGDGKSTIAAMLSNNGHPLLADDTVAIDLNNQNIPTVLPGFPQFKLYPDSVTAAFNEDPAQLEEIASNVIKRSRRADQFCNQKLPLQAIYVLAEGNEVEIIRLSPQEALHYLIANSYMARFTNNWLQNGRAAANLMQCSKIVNSVPVYKLERPRNMSNLKEITSAIKSQTY